LALMVTFPFKAEILTDVTPATAIPPITLATKVAHR
jgi:hypothetical protein